MYKTVLQNKFYLLIPFQLGDGDQDDAGDAEGEDLIVFEFAEPIVVVGFLFYISIWIMFQSIYNIILCFKFTNHFHQTLVLKLILIPALIFNFRLTKWMLVGGSHIP